MASARCVHADEGAAVDDADPVGQVEHLVELGGHEQHGGALVAHLDDAAVDELDRADVEAPRGLGHDQERRRRRCSSRAMITFCWLPPERLSTGTSGAGGADVEALHELERLAVDGGLVAEAAAGEGLPPEAVEHEVVGDAERPDEAVLVAVLGHVGHAQLEDVAGRGVGDVVAGDLDGAAHLGAHADERLDELALAVALHAGDAEDLTGAHLEVEAVDRGDAPVVLARRGPWPAARRRVGLRRAPCRW